MMRVVNVWMGVFEQLMRVRMRGSLGQMQPDDRTHESGGQPEWRWRRLAQQQLDQRRADAEQRGSHLGGPDDRTRMDGSWGTWRAHRAYFKLKVAFAGVFPGRVVVSTTRTPTPVRKLPLAIIRLSPAGSSLTVVLSLPA